MEQFVIEVDDPRRDDVRAVLDRHLEFARAATPAEYVHALDLEGLLDPAVTLFSFRRDGRVVGVGAIEQLDPTHVELKSMHTIEEARGRGVGRALVAAAEAWARGRGCTEFASDALLDNATSAAAHKALGFEEVEQIRCFRKTL